MGDRVLWVCTDDSGTITPAVYGHDAGRCSAETIRKAAGKFRKDDAAYSIAALCRVAHEEADPGRRGVSVGLFKGPRNLKPGTLGKFGTDAGVWVINVSTGRCDRYDGSGCAETIELDPLQFHL